MNSLCTQDKNGSDVDHSVDILFGGGKQRFDQVIDTANHANRTVIDSAIRKDIRLLLLPLN